MKPWKGVPCFQCIYGFMYCRLVCISVSLRTWDHFFWPKQLFFFFVLFGLVDLGTRLNNFLTIFIKSSFVQIYLPETLLFHFSHYKTLIKPIHFSFRNMIFGLRGLNDKTWENKHFWKCLKFYRFPMSLYHCSHRVLISKQGVIYLDI